LWKNQDGFIIKDNNSMNGLWLRVDSV